ncbi:nicotinate phosphoribosyltransferase [Rhodohalobacter barkolensis]|uniref:Nicotinate phosphoribosyltransferase n=1 Tax=Rhodohalobacter barkolensis TaxID=2053187 RepID=A0A2N0VI52_9BACT|nr:nicotinate phosphoribosyltransferase [Rhodohalobacter barkolensis]PKD43867.1 nicotinate phosphoribosyltransferase [Rhodohalobacter barkolensis]
MFDYTATYTDQYQITMSQVYFHKGMKNETAIFDYFFRKLPFEGGYTIFAGLEDLLKAIENLRFDQKDLELLEKEGMDQEFLDYLEDFKFSGNIYSAKEGDLIFPNRPVLSVEAPIIEAQLLETLTLNTLNYQSLIATKASRMRLAAGDRKLVDFGLRRAPGTGGYAASRAAVIGGFNSTSNVRSGRDYNIPISGTMAHSFVQRYDEEIDSFRDFAEVRAHDCVLLVDTYDTLKSGVPNAIKVGKEMEERGEKLKGIRLDSGDLAWLAKESRRMLDEAGLDYVKIAASNQIDEEVIKSLLNQNAPIDLFGVGTSLVTGRPDSALDGVYKLSYANEEPRLKLSETVSKINLPGKKQVYRLFNEDGSFYGGEVVALADEDDFDIMVHPSDPKQSRILTEFTKEPLLEKVVENGKRISIPRATDEIAEFSRQQLEKLPKEFKRFDNPHAYKVGLTKKLKELRDSLVHRHKERV